MSLNHLLCGVALIVSSASCQSASAPPATGSVDTCGLSTVGPLIGYSYQTMPPAVADGGPIADGVYDLVQMVDHGRASGPWSSNEAPALRMAFRFTTEERSTNHSEGSLVSAMDVPPAHYCEPARFATIEHELRGLRHDNEFSSTPYAATRDTVMLVYPHATFVFRRRA